MASESEPTPPTTSPTDTPSPPTGLETFHKFADFAPELQMMVWECVPTTRRCFVVDRKGLAATPVPHLSPRHQVILSVCKQSRKIALQRFIPAYALRRSPESSPASSEQIPWHWEVSLRPTPEILQLSSTQTPGNRDVAHKIYMDPACDLFDITFISRAMVLKQSVEGAAMVVKSQLTELLDSELPKRVENVAVATPEYRPERMGILGLQIKNFDAQDHGGRHRSALESLALPKLKTLIMVPACDIMWHHRETPFLDSSYFFEERLLAAAQINDVLAFKGQVVEANFVIPRRSGSRPTVVRKVGERSCYMEIVPDTPSPDDIWSWLRSLRRSGNS